MSSKLAHVRGTQAAAALRLREQLGFEPVDIWQVLERMRIPVAMKDFGEHGGDGLYLWEDDEPLIVVNEFHRPARQRFTVAHELAHHEMHRYEEGGVLFADGNIFGSEDEREAEANAFAAYFLAPDEALRLQLGERAGGHITPDDIVELMPVFGLSYLALTYRLLNAGLIDKAQRMALAENAQVEDRLRRAGIDEDTVFRAPPRLPRAHISAALQLYEDRVIPAARLGELLAMSTQDAVAFASKRGVNPTEPPIDDDAVKQLLGEQ